MGTLLISRARPGVTPASSPLAGASTVPHPSSLHYGAIPCFPALPERATVVAAHIVPHHSAGTSRKWNWGLSPSSPHSVLSGIIKPLTVSFPLA